LDQQAQKSIKQRLVYDFFYPGILGSMLYDLLPLKSDTLFYIRLFMVVFFSVDYFHLYFFMDGKFRQQQKDTWAYVGFDFLVAVLMFVAFKYADTNNFYVVWSVALVPLCFLVYSIQLKYSVVFYSIYAITSLIVATVFQKITDVKSDNSYLVLGFLILTTLVYGGYVLSKSKEVNQL
jgi:hypothetical protein